MHAPLDRSYIRSRKSAVMKLGFDLEAGEPLAHVRIARLHSANDDSLGTKMARGEAS